MLTRTPRIRSIFAALVVAAGLWLVPSPASAEDTERSRTWMVGSGAWGVKPRDLTSYSLDLEHRWPLLPWRIDVTAGGLFNFDGGVHLRAGFARSFDVDRWQFTVSLAGGLYVEGNSDDLGHPVEFRSALETTYHLGAQTWVGLSISHLSNASLAENNSGIEVLTAIVVWRLGG